MSEVDVCALTVAQLGRLISGRELSPVEVADAYLARIAELEPSLNSYVSILAESALSAAAAAEREIGMGNYRGPLHGVPLALKDLFDLEGEKTTASSKILADNIASKDSTVARRFKQAGAVIIGKTNLHEFAFGVTTDNPHYGATRNPWDTSRVPGGSSGGSGAAVAAGLCAAATGTDTGGSIRIPAALCGIVGLKPTFGRVSKAGVIPLAWSLDHAGPMTRTVEDAAILLNAMAGYDPGDPSSADQPAPDFVLALVPEVRGKRIGIPRRFFYDHVDPEILNAVESAIGTYRAMGATIEEVDLPHISYASSAFQVTIHSEAAAYHEPWLLSRPGDYGADVRSRLEIGRTTLATEYLAGQRTRSLIAGEFAHALAHVDALLTPTVPVTAVAIGQEEVTIGGARFELRPTYNRLTSVISLVGLPAISVPCGFSSEGLPIGMQLVGRYFDEVTLIALANAYESATDWHTRRPAVK